MKSKTSGVRKGAWTQDEDILLRKCIQKYGEGKWHQVPHKAGLNRCRKSCRLRWLNYLKPDIKRGEFAADEVDLLVRLHKLLGNRWSLIAGRIPGRTANDVKNYWNTHMQKKLAAAKPKDDQLTTETTLIKPRARTFSTNLYCSTTTAQKSSDYSIIDKSIENNLSHLPPPELPPVVVDDGIRWWDDLFDDKEAGGGVNGSDEGDPLTGTFWASTAQKLGEDSEQEVPNAWSDFSTDVDIWHLLNSD